MDWYNAFNAIEAALWAVVAITIAVRVPCANWQQRSGALIGSTAFVAFGGSDLLEIGRAGALPLWLWGLKIGCGCAILTARFTWLGWNHFRWRSREFLFGLACLIAVIFVIVVQRLIEPPASTASHRSTQAPQAIRGRGHVITAASASANSRTEA